MFELLRAFEKNSNKTSENKIDAGELKKLMLAGSSITIIDVSEPHEYRAGHIDKAINIPLGILERSVSAFSTENKIVLYCAHGIRSRFGLKVMKKLGFNNVHSLNGGFAAWRGI